MKAVLIIHNTAIDSDVDDAMASIGIEYYSKFTDVLGKGRLSEPRLNTDIWPGTNTGTLLVVEDGKAKEVMDKVRQMRERLGTDGIKAFMWDIEAVT